MWFRCSGGNGTGGGATITVTYSSQFYNKTMTCTKGTKTYTKTTTSSGSTVFDVDETGTWTVTCDGISRTVDVVLEYTTQMAITKTITVYGAASDTISFTDMTGAKTVTTDTNGQGSVSITFIPPSESITFTSSYAKYPSTAQDTYSKAISITENTTSIYVMPDGALYWYQYFSDNCGIISPDNGWSISGSSWKAPTYNTHDLTIQGDYYSSNYRHCGISSLSPIDSSQYSTCKLSLKNTSNNSASWMTYGQKTSKTMSSSYGEWGNSVPASATSLTISLSGSKYVGISSSNGSYSTTIEYMVLE